MSSQKIKFGDKEIDKKEFYLSKQAVLLNSVDLSKIVFLVNGKLVIPNINIFADI